MGGHNNSETLSISNAARLVGVSIQTLRRWDKSGNFKPSYISPGGHRYYSRDDLAQYTRNLFRLAKEWAAAATPSPPPTEFHCQTSSAFQARLSAFESAVRKVPELDHDGQFSLIVSVIAEIGDNAFAHNLGSWPDVPGIYFAFDANRRQVAVADRGVGILTTLRRVRPALPNDHEALTVAFTELISARAPEKRGNGLKYVRQVVTHNSFKLLFQSGQAALRLSDKDSALTIIPADVPIQGTMAFLEY